MQYKRSPEPVSQRYLSENSRAFSEPAIDHKLSNCLACNYLKSQGGFYASQIGVVSAEHPSPWHERKKTASYCPSMHHSKASATNKWELPNASPIKLSDHFATSAFCTLLDTRCPGFMSPPPTTSADCCTKPGPACQHPCCSPAGSPVVSKQRGTVCRATCLRVHVSQSQSRTNGWRAA